MIVSLSDILWYENLCNTTIYIVIEVSQVDMRDVNDDVSHITTVMVMEMVFGLIEGLS